MIAWPCLVQSTLGSSCFQRLKNINQSKAIPPLKYQHIRWYSMISPCNQFSLQLDRRVIWLARLLVLFMSLPARVVEVTDVTAKIYKTGRSNIYSCLHIYSTGQYVRRHIIFSPPLPSSSFSPPYPTTPPLEKKERETKPKDIWLLRVSL